MAKPKEWVKTVTPQFKHDMQESGRAAYANGCGLREDAVTLFSAQRYPRSAALAILAEEEFSKAFLMLICAEYGRWDSTIFMALRKHANKQGISEAMLDYLAWFNENYKGVAVLNQFAFIPMSASIDPGEKKINEITEKAKNRFSKPIKDYLKQDAFYVSIDDNGKIISIPSAIGNEEAKQCLKAAEKFQVITEVLLGIPNAAERFAKL
jgi:AbiV family abortive infection protein